MLKVRLLGREWDEMGARAIQPAGTGPLIFRVLKSGLLGNYAARFSGWSVEAYSVIAKPHLSSKRRRRTHVNSGGAVKINSQKQGPGNLNASS